MTKRFFKTVTTLSMAAGLIPFTASASTIFDLGGFAPSAPDHITFSSAISVAATFGSLTYGSTTLSNDSFDLSYASSAPTDSTMITLSSSAAVDGFTADETLLTIVEAGVLDPWSGGVPGGTAVNLYSDVSSLTFASNFAADLGMATTTPAVGSVTNVLITATAGPPIPANAAGGYELSAATFQMTVPGAAAPEPSTMVLLGLAMIAVGARSVRRSFGQRGPGA